MENQEFTMYMFHFEQHIQQECPHCKQQLNEQGVCLECSADPDDD